MKRSTDTFSYSYKASGSQLDEMDLPNGAKSTFSYDGLGRLTQVQDLKSTAANISNFTYGYDNRDVKTHVQRALGTATAQKIDYSYDDINQLLTEVSDELTPVVNNAFTYDAAQNRTASTVDSTNSSFTINSLNQISTYTLGGSPVGITHDDNGNTTQLGPKTLTWDDANRLTSVTIVGVSRSEYEYDGLDRRRITKSYSWNASTSNWDLQGERRFIYNGMDIIEERDGSNNLITFYTRTGNIGEVLSRTTPTDTFYYHYDGNGNVVSLTGASENVVATYEYDAYGNLQASSGAEANNNPFRFSTKYFDVTAGFYDYGFRFYDPVAGRWLSRDPIAEDGGINLYAFVGNRPVNAWDEYGEQQDSPRTPQGIQTQMEFAKEGIHTSLTRVRSARQAILEFAKRRGIDLTQHAAKRVFERCRNVEDVIDIYKRGGAYWNPRTRSYIIYSMKHGQGIVVDKAGKVITVLRHAPRPNWWVSIGRGFLK